MKNPPSEHGARVPAGGDRFRRRRKIFGRMSIDYKVSSSDTEGDLFGAMSRLKEPASREELRRLFRSHGMEVTGPPLEVE